MRPAILGTGLRAQISPGDLRAFLCVRGCGQLLDLQKLAMTVQLALDVVLVEGVAGLRLLLLWKEASRRGVGVQEIVLP